MKKKYFQIGNILGLVLLQIISCTSPPDIEKKFEQSTTERQNAKKKELYDLLLSSKDGWKMIYFPDRERVGGYTHLFKFDKDYTVQMASDVDSNTKTFKSEYAIENTSLTSLTFITRSRIHQIAILADLEKPLGDYQFLYIGKNDNEIIFESAKTAMEVRFIKATAKDWIDLNNNFEFENQLYFADQKHIFDIYEGSIKKKVGSFEFNRATRILAIRFYLNIWNNYPLALTAKGFILDPPLIENNQEFREFVYDKKTKTFVSTSSNAMKIVLRGEKWSD